VRCVRKELINSGSDFRYTFDDGSQVVVKPIDQVRIRPLLEAVETAMEHACNHECIFCHSEFHCCDEFVRHLRNRVCLTCANKR